MTPLSIAFIAATLYSYSSLYHVLRHPFDPKLMEKSLMKTIGALSTAQHEWFIDHVAALKSKSLSPKAYGEQLITLLAQASQQ